MKTTFGTMSKKTVYSGTTIHDARIPKSVTLSGWRFYGFIGCMVGTLGLMLYPIVLDPVLHVDKYKKSHEEMQTELFQSGLLPGQLKKWDDPFSKRK